MIYCILLLMGFVNGCYSIHSIYNNDYYWHVSVGRWILENKQIPYYDLFSWVGKQNNFTFISHEWLSDIIMYLLGEKIILLVLLIIVSLLFYFICKYMKFDKKIDINNVIKLVYLFMIIKILSSIEVRPLMFSLLLFNIFLILLYRLINNYDKKFFIGIVILQLLWVNLHGGSSSLIPLLLFIMIGYGLFEKLFNNKNCTFDNRTIKCLIILLVFVLIVSLINPYTYKIIIYPFINMLDNTMLSDIGEWHSIDFHGLLGIYYFIVLFIPFISLFTNKKKIELIDLIVLFLFLFMSLRSVRFIQFYIFIGSYIVGKYLNIKLNLKIKYKINEKVVLSFICICLFIMGIVQLSSGIKTIGINYSYSEEAINKVIEYNPKRMLNDYDNGGYLTYKLYDTDIDVFINSIYDIYSNNIIYDYNKLINGIEFNETLEKYDFDLVIVPKNNRMEYYIKNNNNYKLYYEDESAVIYIKK